MIIWSMYAWHGDYDAMQLIQIKRNRNSDTHIYGSSWFTTWQFKCWLAWQRQGKCELHKIKWSGVTIFGNTQILHMSCIRWYASYHVKTWCEMQTSIWMPYSESTHFSDKLSYGKHFIPNYHSKDINYARFNYLWKHLNNGSYFSLLKYKTDVRFELHMFLWIQNTYYLLEQILKGAEIKWIRTDREQLTF
jgi:hypothetical protein